MNEVELETGEWIIPNYEPPFLGHTKVSLECGCNVLIGLRVDTSEVAVVFTDCTAPGHGDAMAEGRDEYRRFLESDAEPDGLIADSIRDLLRGLAMPTARGPVPGFDPRREAQS